MPFRGITHGVRPKGFWERRSIRWSQRLIASRAEPGEVVERAAAGWTPASFALDDDDDYYEDDPEPEHVDVIATDRSLWIHRKEAGTGETDMERLRYSDVSQVGLDVRQRVWYDGSRRDTCALEIVSIDGREWNLGFEDTLGIHLAELVQDLVDAVRNEPTQ
jgi:hypothetical protein